jgi:hypothetical protein
MSLEEDYPGVPGPVLEVLEVAACHPTRPHRARPRGTYTRGVDDDSARPACRPFVWWWLGGFCFAGTIIAFLTLAAVFGSAPFLGFLGIAVLGAIVGLLVGFGIAQLLVVIAEGLEWDEKPR